MRYFFSGSLTRTMIEALAKTPGYQPIDVLVSQLDRSSIHQMIKFQDEGLINKLFIDSGAYSVHTGKAKLNLDEYIEFLNDNDDRIALCAQVDTIPGTFGKAKCAEDYVQSAKSSWDNYLYMREKLQSPEKLIPVYHYGESVEALNRMLDYTDNIGNHIPVLGLSPANDVHQSAKNVYLREMYDVIAKSHNPNVKTHLFGMTSLDALRQFPCYSADSVSHRLQSAYGKVIHPKFGTITVSRASRQIKNKSQMNFFDIADDASIAELEQYVGNLGLTLDQIQDDNVARVVVCMYTIMQAVNEINAVGVKPARRSRSLF